ALLLQRPGQILTREELQQELWPSGTFVDYEQGLATAVNKAREALGDSSANPRFIETVPRCGYRFIAPVTTVLRESPEPALPAHPPRGSRRIRIYLIAAVAALASLVLVGWLLHKPYPRHIESLAVLPLHNLSADPAEEYFADGMTDELIADLGKLSQVRVKVCPNRRSVHLSFHRRSIPPPGRPRDYGAAGLPAIRCGVGRACAEASRREPGPPARQLQR